MSARQPDGRSRDATIAAVVRAGVPAVSAIYRFGSSVIDATRADSDIDIAVLAPEPLDPLVRFDLQERVASAIHRSVDLIDLRRTSTVMASQVVTQGVVLDEPDPAARARFEDFVYSSYARLNEERRAILERVRIEGTVYGR
jgi:predicted nucleotidyltransferase